MRGLFTKSLYEAWGLTLLVGLALLALEALHTYVFPQIAEGMGEVLKDIPFVRSMVTALLGTELGDQISARAMQATLWVHPVLLALVWAHEIVWCTRMPAGEIDRGTIDVLFSLPVSRLSVYGCESIVWLFSGMVILTMGLVGFHLASPAMPAEMRPELSRVLWITINLYCVYLAVGGIAFLVSTLCDRRGRAIGIVFGLVLASFLLNFLAQFWPPAQQIAFLGVLQYYQPAQITQGTEPPWRDIGVLVAVGAVAWSLGAVVISRRSICTV
jgi:ABC-2 type transport system permease protein